MANTNNIPESEVYDLDAPKGECAGYRFECVNECDEDQPFCDECADAKASNDRDVVDYEAREDYFDLIRERESIYYAATRVY